MKGKSSATRAKFRQGRAVAVFHCGKTLPKPWIFDFATYARPGSWLRRNYLFFWK
jgi:hypothetical protein